MVFQSSTHCTLIVERCKTTKNFYWLTMSTSARTLCGIPGHGIQQQVLGDFEQRLWKSITTRRRSQIAFASTTAICRHDVSFNLLFDSRHFDLLLLLFPPSLCLSSILFLRVFAWSQNNRTIAPISFRPFWWRRRIIWFNSKSTH